MLEKILLENFKSYKERTEISFSKTNYEMLPQNVSADGILKGVIFVGANASGKSNIISAIKFLLDSLFANNSIKSDLYRCLFSDRESFAIEYYFLINGKHIVYSLDINSYSAFITETLIMDDTLLFERIGQGAKSYIADEKGKNYDENDVDKETLFLRTLYFNTKFTSNGTLRMWMDYLRKSVYLNAYERQTTGYERNLQELGILHYLQHGGGDTINNFFEEYNFNQSVEFSHKAKSNMVTFIAGASEEEKSIFFRRKGLNIPVPFLSESLGNQNLLYMFPAFFSVIRDGGMLLIDEFSSGFHNDLEELLVKYFMEKAKKSQMIFVSHSTNLLTNSLLRPDQEYSVDFEGQRGSVVKRFSTERPRMAQNIEKMYLSGVFGGLPNYEVTSDDYSD